MAVIDVLPSDGKVIGEGPVGCSVDVCCDDFRHLDIGLPPEILRLKDAGYLTQAVAACDRLLEQNPEPSLAACVRAERYRMLETPLHFSVSRDQAIAMIREEWPEFTEEQLDDLINRKRIDWRFIDGELFVLDNFLDSLRVYPKEVPGLRPDSADGIALRNQMLREMESQNGLARVITLKASVSVPGALEGEAVRAWLPVAAACRQQSQIEVLDMTSGGTVAPENVSARAASWTSSTEHSFSVTYRYHVDAAYCDIYGGALPSHPCMDAPLPEDTSEDRPHIAFTPYMRQLTERVIDGLENPLDRARAIYDYLTQHIDYRYQHRTCFWAPSPMTVHTRSAAIAALWRSRLSPCAASRACPLAGRVACMLRLIRWGRTTGQSSIRRKPGGSTPTCHLDLLLAGWARSGAAVTTLAISIRGVWWPTIDSRLSLCLLSTACVRTPMTTRWARPRLTDVDVVSGRCCARLSLSKCSKFHFRTNQQKAVIN